MKIVILNKTSNIAHLLFSRSCVLPVTLRKRTTREFCSVITPILIGPWYIKFRIVLVHEKLHFTPSRKPLTAEKNLRKTIPFLGTAHRRKELRKTIPVHWQCLNIVKNGKILLSGNKSWTKCHYVNKIDKNRENNYA